MLIINEIFSAFVFYRTFLKPFKTTTVASNLEHDGEDNDDEVKQRRQGVRLHSLQLNNKIEYNKQERFKTLNYTPTDSEEENDCVNDILSRKNTL